MAPEKKRGDKNDVTWEHCKPLENDKKRLQCNYCKKTFSGGVFRMKHHIARTRKNVAECSQASEEATEMFRKLLESNKTDQEEGDKRRCDIARPDSYYPDRDPSTDQGEKGKRKASMDAVSKKKQCTMSHFGEGPKLPSYDKLQNKLLENKVEVIKESMYIHKERGCTIMSDGWTDGAHRSIMNFFVSSFSGTCFLGSVDISSISQSAENLFELFDSVVEEVGEEDVVQFVTDSASANVEAGKLLMQKRKELFWSPCAAHQIDLMLADIAKLPVHAETIAIAGFISLYIYQHSWVHDLMREHTQNTELVNPASTRFYTSYRNLKIIREQIDGLRSMFKSKEWESSLYSKEEEARKVRDIVLSDTSFWLSIDSYINCVAPLVKVLRLLDSDEKPTMPYVYEMMDEATIAVSRNVRLLDYKLYWSFREIVDLRWNSLLNPLHAAAWYLNPARRNRDIFTINNELEERLYNLLERLYRTSRERVAIDQQLDRFKLAMGSFGRKMAKDTKCTKRPDLWWESYGGSCPDLQRLAIPVLSQTCSASGRERNWSTFEMIHFVRRNRLEQARLNALVYVKYNWNLRERQKMRKAKGDVDPIYFRRIFYGKSDDEWITEKKDRTLPEDPSWLNMCLRAMMEEEEPEDPSWLNMCLGAMMEEEEEDTYFSYTSDDEVPIFDDIS